MNMSAITSALEGVGVSVYEGYPATGAKLPYIVHRPLLTDVAESSVSGNALVWDPQHALYCCAASVAACYNLANAVLRTLHGKRVDGSVLSTSMGYSGAQMEGHYESQVTIQTYQGVI